MARTATPTATPASVTWHPDHALFVVPRAEVRAARGSTVRGRGAVLLLGRVIPRRPPMTAWRALDNDRCGMVAPRAGAGGHRSGRYLRHDHLCIDPRLFRRG